MKLHRLELTGFGPFRDRQVVDFDAFDDDGIFLIAGRTGAGKSSILDGVCFALYGGVPRYDGADRQVRSDHCAPGDPSQVVLEFTVGDTRWRVTRAPEYERPKARGTGTTTQPHAAVLERREGDDWVGVAARPREVALELDRVLGLNQQQFLQVILLAQNRFAQFLLARNDDRQTLLRTLFGSRRYGDYQELLEQRRRAASELVGAADMRQRLLLDAAERRVAEHGFGAPAAGVAEPVTDVVGRLEALRHAAARADDRVKSARRDSDAAAAAAEAATAAHAELTALHERRARRAASRAALSELEARSTAVAADRAALQAATAAELLREPIERAESAAGTAAEATEALRAARTAWAAHGDDPDIDGAALAERIDRITGELAMGEAAAAAERQSVELGPRADGARAQAHELAAALARADARARAYPGELAALETELAQQLRDADRLDAALAARTATAAQLGAARDAERLRAERDLTEQHHAAAAALLAAATAEWARLLRLRLAGHAAELAAELVDGEPCAVCGATAHPHPAAPAAESATAEHVDAAAAARDAAADGERAAGAAARRAAEAHTATASLAGGKAAPELERALADDDAAVAAAEAAAHRGAQLTDRRQQVIAERDAAAAARELLAAQAVQAERDIAVLAEQCASLLAVVDAARGEYASVAERIAAATALRASARTLNDALRAHQEAAASSLAAGTERDARIAASDFADTAGARSALRTAAECAALDEAVRAHEVALASERDRMRELELALAGAPDTPIDLDAAALAVAAAQQEFSNAVAAAARTAQAAQALADEVAQLEAEQAGIVGLLADHELVAQLSNAVAGRNAKKMDLETFVLAGELEQIVIAANLRLDDMSAGRYRLRHTDAVARGASGLGLEVVDAYTGQARPPQSLSGGETFLASFALALGLAQVVTDRAGGIRLDTLFIDEGFGSLDADTLELAMRTLDELRRGGRTVGVISHVEAMKEQLPAQLHVAATPHGPSVVRPAGGTAT